MVTRPGHTRSYDPDVKPGCIHPPVLTLLLAAIITITRRTR